MSKVDVLLISPAYGVIFHMPRPLLLQAQQPVHTATTSNHFVLHIRGNLPSYSSNVFQFSYSMPYWECRATTAVGNVPSLGAKSFFSLTSPLGNPTILNASTISVPRPQMVTYQRLLARQSDGIQQQGRDPFLHLYVCI